MQTVYGTGAYLGLVRYVWEAGEPRPLLHVRPRKRDCDKPCGWDAGTVEETMKMMPQIRGHRCAGCHRKVFRVRFMLSRTERLDLDA